MSGCLKGGAPLATLWEALLHRQITGSRPENWWEVDWSGGREGGDGRVGRGGS
jgi:hypothetical protein